ncbi:Aminodeoxyfutalosine deaminase [subsurface metagenome]
MVREREVLLEICLTSNWLTRSVPSLQEHPLPQLYKNRILVSINSDDPQLMDIDLVNEYELCVKHYNFSLDDFFEINELSVRRSFLDEEIKSYVLRDWRIQLPPIGRP